MEIETSTKMNQSDNKNNQASSGLTDEIIEMVKNAMQYPQGSQFDENSLKLKKKAKSVIIEDDHIFDNKDDDFASDAFEVENLDFSFNKDSDKTKHKLMSESFKTEGNNSPNKTKDFVVFERNSPVQKFYYKTGVLRYEGEALNDQPHGFGEFYYENGMLAYDGEWLNGKRDGSGTLFSKKTGNKLYHGYWVSGEKSQNGTLYNELGQKIYEGIFIAGKKYLNGQTFYPDSGAVAYNGNFQQDLEHGQGVLYYENGKICYKGSWKYGKWDGTGKHYNKKGILLHEGAISAGVWAKNKGHPVNCYIM